MSLSSLAGINLPIQATSQHYQCCNHLYNQPYLRTRPCSSSKEPPARTYLQSITQSAQFSSVRSLSRLNLTYIKDNNADARLDINIDVDGYLKPQPSLCKWGTCTTSSTKPMLLVPLGALLGIKLTGSFWYTSLCQLIRRTTPPPPPSQPKKSTQGKQSAMNVQPPTEQPINIHSDSTSELWDQTPEFHNIQTQARCKKILLSRSPSLGTTTNSCSSQSWPL